MRHAARLSALASVLLLAPILTGTARAQLAADQAGAERALLVVNRTAQPIIEVYVTNSDDQSWGDNRLPGRSIGPGQSSRIRLGRDPTCSFDLRVVYQDGRMEDRRRIDACAVRQAVFEGSVVARVPTAAERHPITIANHARLPIQELYVSPSTSGDWGEELLGGQLIAPGADASVAHDGVCVADLRVVFSNLAGEERRRVDICQHAQIEIAPGWTTSSDLDTKDPAPSAPPHHT
jgi:hypothetical protein